MDSKKSANSSKNKKGSKLLKILIMVVVLSFVAVGSIIISDLFFSENDPTPEMETVTITVSDTDIYLNGSEKMSLSSLESYFTERFKGNDYCTIALINDTLNPADIETYNSVVELLGKFGITQEPLTLPATEDELTLASIDEN